MWLWVGSLKEGTERMCVVYLEPVEKPSKSWSKRKVQWKPSVSTITSTVRWQQILTVIKKILKYLAEHISIKNKLWTAVNNVRMCILHLVHTGVCVRTCVHVWMLIQIIQTKIALLGCSHKPLVITKDMNGSQMGDHFLKFAFTET